MIIARIINDGAETIKLSDLTREIKKDPSIDECGAIFTFEGIVRGKDSAKTTEKIILTTNDHEKTEKELRSNSRRSSG